MVGIKENRIVRSQKSPIGSAIAFDSSAIATIPGDYRKYDKMAHIEFKEDLLLLFLNISLIYIINTQNIN